MYVRFLQRCGAYFPGANPILDDAEAARLIAAGICEPFDKPAEKPAKVEAEPEPPPEPAEEPAEETVEPPSHPLRRRR